MRVRGRHQHVIDGHTRGLGDLPLGVVEDFARNAHAVGEYESDPRAAVVEHQTAGVQFVVDVLSGR